MYCAGGKMRYRILVVKQRKDTAWKPWVQVFRLLNGLERNRWEDRD